MCEFNSNSSFWIIHRPGLPIWHYMIFSSLSVVGLVTSFTCERWPRMNDFFIDGWIDRGDSRHMGIKVLMWFGFNFECTVMPTLWQKLCLPSWITKILILRSINQFSSFPSFTFAMETLIVEVLYSLHKYYYLFSNANALMGMWLSQYDCKCHAYWWPYRTPTESQW